jgi:hypothetical protein
MVRLEAISGEQKPTYIDTFHTKAEFRAQKEPSDDNPGIQRENLLLQLYYV